MMYLCHFFWISATLPHIYLFFPVLPAYIQQIKKGTKDNLRNYVKILYFYLRKINSCVPFGLFAKKKSIRNQNPCMFCWSPLAVKCTTIYCRSVCSNVKRKSSFNQVNGQIQILCTLCPWRSPQIWHAGNHYGWITGSTHTLYDVFPWVL